MNRRNDPEQRTRTLLIVGAAILLMALLIGQCGFDVGVAYQIGHMGNCLYPPHVCQQP